MSRDAKIGLSITAALVFAGLLAVSQVVCLSAWLRYGMVVGSCPSGEVVPIVGINAYGMRRGTSGTVEISAYGAYTTGPADQVRTAAVGRVKADLALMDGENATILEPVKGWKDNSSGVYGAFVLPKDLKDGTYRLRAKVDSPLGEKELSVPLDVYAPAKIHVITDRPLYEPGNTIHFRATVLRARDLAPLDDRPGRFEVTDPEGNVVLEEKIAAGKYGVAAGSFPLDDGAPLGTWTIRWRSGSNEGSRQVRVAPFELPRFVIDATPRRPFYLARQKPVLQGAIRYSSGAPVAAANMTLTWSTSGAWPPPHDWKAALPKTAVTDAHGRFELELPEVPGDLKGKVNLFARIAATDTSGDRVEGGGSVLLVEDRIDVDVVTELGRQLVDGFNNRMYVRATTPTGGPLANAKLTMKRAWDPTDEGLTATSDVDGVAAFQIDPGPAVNVVVPPMPVRAPPRPPAVAIGSISERISNGYILADQRSIDRWKKDVEKCVHLVTASSDSTTISFAVAPTGTLSSMSAEDSRLGRCVAAALRNKRLSSGAERLYDVSFSMTPDLPTVSVSMDGVPETPTAVSVALSQAALDARRCLPVDVEGGQLQRLLTWRIGAGGRLSVRFGKDPSVTSTRLRGAAASCVERSLAAARVPADVLTDADRKRFARRPHFGYARLSVSPRASVDEIRPRATTFLGYELLVEAHAKDGEKLGDTKITLRPGTIPALRIRATPQIAKPNDEVELTFLRGPSFSGELPKKTWMRSYAKSIEIEIDREKRRASAKLPADAEGWFEVSVRGARALVYVRSEAELAVAVDPNKSTYRPGEKASLAIKTTAGGNGAPAAVGLIGVDQSLGQLATLPGPGEMSSLHDLASMSEPAFGALDAKALSMGLVRGDNAIAATVLRVTNIPSKADIDAYTSANGRTVFDPVGPLTDHFYEVLQELHAQTRKWEEDAPKGEVMKPPKMASLFASSVDAVRARGGNVDDAYGRPLKLSRLPRDLLALTDPRAVVIEGTRLPEDVENWTKWVERNRP